MKIGLPVKVKSVRYQNEVDSMEILLRSALTVVPSPQTEIKYALGS